MSAVANDASGGRPVAVRRLATTQPDFEAEFARLQHWSAETDAAIEGRVAEILADVQRRGDAAVLEYTARFDGLHAASMRELELTAADLDAALAAITPAQRRALEDAAARVRAYHQRQLDAVGRGFSYRDRDGSLLGQKVTPLDRVGIYVPGGKAAYPSSVLMNAVPAQVAGVREIVMVVPTPVRGAGAPGGARGERNALVLAAARIAGATRVFTIGGAQAVAALAYGTATVPAVDKITGPGNAYVASAKRRVFGQVGIDMIAGPSEILVLADGSTPAEWVAMDLFSQAEHDELAQSILLCPDAAYVDTVQREIDRLLPGMPRRDVIRASLEGRGALIVTRSMEEACEISNRVAPEHLEVSAREPQRWEPLLRHAGAIFLGSYTSESLGDYCAGPNHVLPTSGTARFSSPLGVYDFQKRSSLIEVSAAGAQVLGPIAAELAYGEGLQAHAQAAELRLDPALAGSVAAASRPLAFNVRPVTADNLVAIGKLEVAAGQKSFVASNPWSLAQVNYEPAGSAHALYDGDLPVGLVLLYDERQDKDEPANRLYVWRLMVDAAQQRRGIGRAAIGWIVERARAGGYASVGLAHWPGEGSAGPFYEKLGFRYTGEVDEGERVMVLTLGEAS